MMNNATDSQESANQSDNTNSPTNYQAQVQSPSRQKIPMPTKGWRSVKKKEARRHIRERFGDSVIFLARVLFFWAMKLTDLAGSRLFFCSLQPLCLVSVDLVGASLRYYATPCIFIFCVLVMIGTNIWSQA